MYHVAVGEALQVLCSDQKQCGHVIYRTFLFHLGLRPLTRNRMVMLCLVEIKLNGHCYNIYIAEYIYIIMIYN